MIIQSIRISNILSFEQKDNIDECQEITFNDNLNIIIGPNGSGKSNFLEIINQIFRNVLFKTYSYNPNNIRVFEKNNRTDLKQTIIIQPRGFNLGKNHYSTKNEQQIKLKIKLSSDDKENLKFILTNRDKINQLSNKYVNQNIVFGNISENEIDICNNLELIFKSDNQNQINIEILTTPVENYIITYLQHFNALQNLILLVNDEKIEKWEILKNTFALISGYRNYNAVTLNFQVSSDKHNQLQGFKMNFLNETTKNATNDEPFVFRYVTSKIGYVYHDLRDSRGTDSGNLVEQLTDETFIEINKTLERIMKLKLDIDRSDKYSTAGNFQFKNIQTNEIVHPSELSAGEKGIIHFIFSIHGYEIKNGVMVIDEPELHLHPQLQQKYVDILKQTSESEKIQFIVATHSPVFVTPETIEGVHRFHMKNNFTKVTTPEIDTRETQIDDKDLVRFLNYTNNAKIFFADRVLMVEGDPDEYFFQTFLEKYNQTNPSIENLEFLDIRGSKNYSDWNDFLKKCGIDTYFVGDLDVILREEFRVMNNTTKQQLKDKFLAQSNVILRIQEEPSYEKLKVHKDDFLKFIKTQPEWQLIENNLQTLQNQGIFILKKGDLEDYIGHIVKGKLTNVVEFCKNQFNGWYDVNDSSVVEIKKIFQTISS